MAGATRHSQAISGIDSLCGGTETTVSKRTRQSQAWLQQTAIIALLHQKQRQVISENDQEYVVATLVDFHIAKVLLENTFKKTIYAIPPKTELLIKTAGELVKAGKHDGVSINELAKKVGWDYDTAKKWFDPGYRKGYFERTREHKGSTAALYVPADKKLPSENILPFTEDLFAIEKSWLGEQDIYDPISGETYKLEPKEWNCTDVPMLTATAHIKQKSKKQHYVYPSHRYRYIGTNQKESWNIH